MQRESNEQTLTWADKTMSVIRTRQLEACEERLSVLPAFGLFSGCSDAEAEALWRISYDAQEHPFCTHLHSARDLQAMVLTQLPAEAALLSPKEHELLERLIALGGDIELMDWSESAPAESLVRRLWCTLTFGEDDRAFLHMPKELLTPLLLVVSSKAHQELASRMLDLHRTVYAALYVSGALHDSTVLAYMEQEVLTGTYAESRTLCRRYLRASYDYTYTEKGEMLLLHPGLTDPARLLPFLDLNTGLDLNDPTLALSEMFDESEWMAAHQMMGLIGGALRPEYQPQTGAEDLFMLAKQGVSLENMAEVLAAMLVIRPTGAMLDCLRLLKSQVICWGRIPTGMVQ